MRAILIAAALFGCGALFLLVSGTRSRPTPEQATDDQAPLLRDALDRIGAIQGEVRELRSSQEELALRLDAVESRPRPVAARTPVPAESPEALDEVRDMVAAIKDPSPATAPGLETYVLDVLDQKEAQEEAARLQRRETARQERLRQRVDDLTQELGLSGYQSQEMLTILTDESTRRDTIFTEMRESGDWDRRAIREKMGGIRDETNTALGDVLTPDQLDRYHQLERGDFGGGGGRGGGDGSGGRGGGGRGGGGRGGGGRGGGG